MLLSNVLTLSAFGLACAAPTGPRRDLDSEIESLLSSLLSSLLGQATAAETAIAATAVGSVSDAALPTASAPSPTDSAQDPFATGQAIKDSTGNCVTVDAGAGNNSSGVDLGFAIIKPCDGSVEQQFDFFSNTTQPPAPIPGSVLVVSTLNQGCLSFSKVDPFIIKLTACVENSTATADLALSQAFLPFDTTGEFTLNPFGNKNVCLASTGGKMQAAPCDSTDDEQSFTLDDASLASATDGFTPTAAASATGATATAGLTGAVV